MKPTGASSSFLVTVMLATSSLFVNAALAFDGYSVAQEFSEPTTYKGVASALEHVHCDARRRCASARWLLHRAGGLSALVGHQGR